MSLLITIVKKKTARGKSNNSYVFLGFGNERIFDISYEAKIHRRFVLNEIRWLTNPQVHTRDRKRRIAFKIEQAKLWSEAIGRNAPLLKGFFVDEPEWRDKLLLCWRSAKVLAKRRSSVT
jgi:hypothetical protein